MNTPADPLQELPSGVMEADEAGATSGRRDGIRAGRRSWLRGDLVRVRGERWRVEGGERFADCRLLRLAGVGRTNRGRHLALLEPFDRPQRLEPSGRLRRCGRRAWMRALGDLLRRAAPFGRLRTAAAARIDLHAYQLEPALAVLNGAARRLLLADEVGLGKTIQAGLIVAEMRAREHSGRALILTPAGLRDQWAAELRERFSMQTAVVDAAMIRRTIGELAAGTNPWSVWPVIIASLDFVKRPEVVQALDPLVWDALVVDEAHTCASAPERSSAVRRLAAHARRVVLVTATPHAGDDEAFAALCDIGRLSSSDPMVMYRRTRPDVGMVRDRRVHLLRVACTRDERRMHRLLDRYTLAVWRSADVTAEARLAMIVLRKRALSSASSLARSVERRLDALFDAVPPPAAQLALPFPGSAEADEQSLEDDEPVSDLAAPGLEAPHERDWLMRLLDAARRAAHGESKIARLSRLLVRAREPAIVFTEYRDTARRLAGALGAIGPVVLLHGGLSRAERADTERAFRAGDADIMVATDAAGEGLNLHHRCRLVVNLELPWNPMRLEQRIGRVDRLGQHRRPHAIHLLADGTAEQRVVRRLLFRQERARRRVGAVTDVVGVIREDDIAHRVMADEPLGAISPVSPDDGPARFSTVDLREMATDEVRRLNVVRIACAAGKHPRRRGGRPNGEEIHFLSALPPRRARRVLLPAGLLCVFLVRLLSADRDDVLDEILVPLHVELNGRPPLVDRSVLENVVGAGGLRDRALEAAAARLQAARGLHARATAADALCERALVEAPGAGRAPIQPGMFDSRALERAERSRVLLLARRREALDRLGRLERCAPEGDVADAQVALVLVLDR